MGKYISKYFFGSSTEQQSSEEEKVKPRKFGKEMRYRSKCFNSSKVEELLAEYGRDEESQQEEEEEQEIKIPKFYIGKDRILDAGKKNSAFDDINNQEVVNSIESIESSILVWDGKITPAEELMKDKVQIEKMNLPLDGNLKMQILAFSSKSEEDWKKYSWPEQLQIVEVLERNYLKPFFEELNQFKPKFGIELERSTRGVQFFEQSRRWSRGYILRANNNINQEVMLMFEFNYYPTLLLLPPT